MAGTFWHMANAMGGIKLQVEDQDAAEAASILAEPETSETSPDDQASAAEQPQPDANQLSKVDPADDDDPDWSLTLREIAADRALRAAVLGLLLLPLQVYAYWLLLQVADSEGAA